jgi:histidine ammonia-lyase
MVPEAVSAVTSRPAIGPVVLTGSRLDVHSVQEVAVKRASVVLDERALDVVRTNRQALEEAIERGDEIYGVTTGLGALVSERVTLDDAAEMQRSVLRSHAAGVGPLLPAEAVRAALTLRLNCLLRGRSGIRPVVLERVALFMNEDLVPAVPCTGSVGASGDLAPSAHAFLPLVGEGAFLAADGPRVASSVLTERGLQPLELAPKEALALINGTHFMAGIGALVAVRAGWLVSSADAIGALTLEAMGGAGAAFDPRVHDLRRLTGQASSAAVVRSLIRGSERIGDSQRIQDAYSLRCIPQVHGACREAIRFFTELVDVDLNAVTDNPIIFDDPLEVISAGNFHGQSLALAFDALRTALATLASISERRTFRLLSPSLNGELPAFLTSHPGRRNGYMVAQITAAALVAELRALANPVSVISIPTSDNQEDHVSMGMTAAVFALEALERAEKVIAIEALCACQALDFVTGRAGSGAEQVRALVREHVPTLDDDRPLGPEIELTRELLASGRLARVVDAVCNGEAERPDNDR